MSWSSIFTFVNGIPSLLNLGTLNLTTKLNCTSPNIASNATLGPAGTIVVANASVTANSIIILSRQTVGANPGILSYVVNPGVGFTISSNNNGDNGVISYIIIN